MLGYATILLVAASVTWICTLLFRRAAIRYGLVVLPHERKVHTTSMPTSGGVAMCIGLMAGLGAAYLLPQFKSVFNGSSMPLGLLFGATIITFVGFVDDVRDVSPPAKVAGQVLAGAIMAHFGVTMLYFRVPFLGSFLLSPDLAALVTVLWIVIIANAINLIDGLDGLAAGIVLIAASALFLYGDRRFHVGLLDGPGTLGPLVAILTVGVCVGFLPHNFNPAKIFMGDAGSMLLGLLLGCAAIILSGQTDDQFSGRTFFFFAPVLIPFIILGVPVVDTLLAIVRRTRKRTSISAPDREHLHHQLMELGHGPRRTVVIMWLWTAVLSGAVLIPSFTNRGNAAVPFIIVGALVALYTYFAPGKKRNGKNGKNGQNGDGEPPTSPLNVADGESFDDSEYRVSSPV